MRNGEKIREALQRAYPYALINVYNDFSAKETKIYFNGTMIARFKSIFWDEDFDNPEEIEIKVKAPLKYFKDYLDTTYDKDLSNTEYFIRNAIGKGVRKWVDESQPNN